MQCYKCECEEFEQRRIEHQTRVGEHTVVDHAVRPVCARCGEYTITATELERLELRAAVVALVDAPPTDAVRRRQIVHKFEPTTKPQNPSDRKKSE